MSDHQANLSLLKIAFSACQDKNSILYAHLKNTAGATYIGENHNCEAERASKAEQSEVPCMAFR